VNLVASKQSGPRSKHQRERIAEEEKKKEVKSKTFLYAGIAVVAAVALIAVAWFFFMQPGDPVTLASMKKNLEDNHYTVTVQSPAHLHGANGAISFSVTTDHGASNVFIYEFSDSDAAATFAASLTPGVSRGILVSGNFVLTADHAHLSGGKYVVDDDIKELFDDLLHGRSVGHNHSHAH